ncbi:MAG TPA: ABC transporter permease [Spirochaetia bacterium]|nr:ABC transporter permease [Spirochaetia bacterium]
MQDSNTGRLGRITASKMFWPFVVLGLILLFNLIFTKGFFNLDIRDGHLFGTTIDILNRSAQIMIIAIGLTLVIATHGIDISVGSVVAISAAMAALLIGGKLVLRGDVQEYVTLVPMPVAILAAVGVAGLAGGWNGLLVSRLKIQPIVATLILMVAGRGVAQLITSGQIITIYYKPFFFLGNGFLFGLPFTVYIVAVVLAFTVFMTRRTALGLYIESIGVNPTASRYSGIKPERIIFWVYVFGSICAGIAGLIVASNVKSADGNNAGDLFELDAILAVVLGGTSLNGGKFYLGGSVIGALIIQSLTTTIYAQGVPPEITLVVKALVVFAVTMLQSESFRKMVFGRFMPVASATPQKESV